MRSLSLFCAVCVCAFLASPGAQASTVTFNMNFELSGASAPLGPPPWMTVTFDDGGTPGSVDLTVQSNLIDNEFAFIVLLNHDPSLNLTDLVFSAPIMTGTFDPPNVNYSTDDDFQADGDGYFDIEVEFSHTNPLDRFGGTETVMFTITDPGVDVITASSFDFQSTPDGDPGTFPVAAQIGGIGVNDESGWISTPEPAALSLLALGGLLLVARRRR